MSDNLAKKNWKRFKEVKRGYYSLILFLIIFILSLSAELWINSKALVVSYNDKFYFPIFSRIYSGKDFGLNYEYEVNYRELKKSFKSSSSKNFVILPLIPYNPYENDFLEGESPPYRPSKSRKHYLGTDTTGRDIVARFVYGLRIALVFSFILTFLNYSTGIIIGCLMGYIGGRFDLILQRLIEIWSNVPFLYVVIIISSIVAPNFSTLLIILALFGWMSMTWQMRTTTYQEKSKEYIIAAKSLGASHWRIIFKYILPNSISLIITFLPFSLAGGITALTSLDYLGFGLPAPTPSWGELLKQGIEHLEFPWIILTVILGLIFILMMITFIGESIREAIDPKKHILYK